MSGFYDAAISGSILILILACFRLLLGKTLPKALFPALWCAAAIRLLLPVALPSPLSIWNLASHRVQTAAGVQIAAQITPFSAASAAKAAADTGKAAVQLQWPILIWAIGAVLLAGYLLIGFLRFHRRFSKAAPAALPMIDEIMQQFHFRRLPVIRTASCGLAPLTYGCIRPVVLLPAELLTNADALRMILTHELAHIRRRDCLRKLLFSVCLCVYWWNPACWLLIVLANRDIELACDALTLRYLGADRRKAYALTLLELAARQAQPHPLCSGFGKPAAEERIQAIMKAKKIPVYLTAIAVIVAAAVVTVFATQAEPPANEENAVLAQRMEQQEIAIRETTVALSLPQEQSIEDSQPAEETTLPAEPIGYVFPLENADATVLDSFGDRPVPDIPVNVSPKYAFHRGVDLEASEGSSVLAVADGTVTVSASDVIYGEQITIQHADGMLTTYCHLSERLVSEGDSVRQGQIIGRSGSTGWVTGPHLHLEVQMDGEYVDPLEALG